MNFVLDEIKKLDSVKVISFDIFDTLIYRTVLIPSYMFHYMYCSNPKLFPDYTDADDWVYVRANTERDARTKSQFKNNTREVTLDEIYECLPSVYQKKKEIKELELECEEKVTILNEEMYSILERLKKQFGYTIILCSDMYLSTEQLKKLLYVNGVDLCLIDKIYVSSELKLTKSKGDICDYITNDLNLREENIFHIGDNFKNDVAMTGSRGVNTYYYSLISESRIRYPFIDFEMIIYHKYLCSELQLIRILAGETSKKYKGAQKDWNVIGSMILGPFMTCCAEWILDEAINNNIKFIRPLMREGEFLTKLLKNAAEERQLNVCIEPIYMSRYVVQTAKYEIITPSDIKKTIYTSETKIQDVFKKMNIEDLADNWKEHWDEKVNDLIKYECNNHSLAEELYEYLSSSEVMEVIRNRNANNKKLLLEYVIQENIINDAMLVDIGWEGSIPKAIYDLILGENQKTNLCSRMFFCKPKAAFYANDGFELKGFIGNYGSHMRDLEYIDSAVMEMLCMCDKGTTVGYKKERDKIIPILKTIEYPQQQIANIKALQDGIITFQKLFLSQKRKKGINADIISLGKEAVKYLERFFSYPTGNESKLLSEIVFDQNNGMNIMISMVGEHEKQMYSSLRKDLFYYACDKAFTRPKLIESINNPVVNLENTLIYQKKFREVSLIWNIKYMLSDIGSEKFVLVGCGENIKIVLRYLKELGVLSRVSGIIDNNTALQNHMFFEIKIYEPNHIFDTNNYYITTIKKSFYESLKKQIMELNEEACIYGVYSG